MTAIVLNILLGSALGFVSGVLPGLSSSIIILFATPFLLLQGPMEVIGFYIGLLTVSQYAGSVAALLLNVPGEASSLPALKESKSLQQAEKLRTAIAGTAIGSFVGAAMALTMIYASINGLTFLYEFYNHSTQSILLLAATIMLILLGDNSRLINLGLVLLGWFLALIGLHPILDSWEFLTFGNPYLQAGIPTSVALLSLYAIPVLLKNDPASGAMAQSRTAVDFREIGASAPSMLRGGLIGSVVGLIPNLSYVLSSNVSYYAEKYFKRRSTHADQTNINLVVAAETANNSAAVTCLIPLLCFGVPIILSEALILNIIGSKVNFSLEWLLQKENLIVIFTGFIISHIIGLITCWPLSKMAFYVLQITKRYFKPILISLLVMIVLYTGYQSSMTVYYGLWIVGLLPLSYVLRKLDTLPLIFMFIMQDQIFNTFYRTYLIYF